MVVAPPASRSASSRNSVPGSSNVTANATIPRFLLHLAGQQQLTSAARPALVTATSYYFRPRRKTTPAPIRKLSWRLLRPSGILVMKYSA